MATSIVTYSGNLRTTAVHLASGTTIITDAPVDNQGKGEAFSPTDLVATSYASCMLTIMGIGALSRGFSIDGTTAEVTKVMGNNPRRIVGIIVKFKFSKNNFTEKQKEFFKFVSETCPVSKSLHPEIKQSVNFEF
ncbi:MAG: osmotically inducible protein OsmC [Bacteroidetes bacterium CG02_land_8_20_14_3_00_31_25]|nr:MAG: osmotically inducible protein OsmC [Bacteroidetes bacterium CG02_land_8_20_14_3_00_31_25]